MQCWWLQPNPSPRTWQILWHILLPSIPRALPSAGQLLKTERKQKKIYAFRQRDLSLCTKLHTTSTALLWQFPGCLWIRRLLGITLSNIGFSSQPNKLRLSAATAHVDLWRAKLFGLWRGYTWLMCRLIRLRPCHVHAFYSSHDFADKLKQPDSRISPCYLSVTNVPRARQL